MVISVAKSLAFTMMVGAKSANGRLSGTFQQALLDQLRPPRLQRKIGLRKGDLLLFRVAVLRDQVAGVPREHDVVDLALAARAQVDHFVDVDKLWATGWPETSHAVLAFEMTVVKLRHSA